MLIFAVNKYQRFDKYQRSRSFTDLGHSSLRFSGSESLKTAGLIETKLPVEPQWGWDIRVCSWDLGCMTQMAIMPIYGKKDFKFFISGTEKLMTFKLGMQYWGLWLYLVYSIDDLSLTLVYFTTWSVLVF